MQLARGIRKSIFGGTRNKLTSGLDFQDAGAAHGTEVGSPTKLHQEPTYAARNKAERERTQGLNTLMRTGSLLNVEGKSVGHKALSKYERFNIWMINEGCVVDCRLLTALFSRRLTWLDEFASISTKELDEFSLASSFCCTSWSSLLAACTTDSKVRLPERHSPLRSSADNALCIERKSNALTLPLCPQTTSLKLDGPSA